VARSLTLLVLGLARAEGGQLAVDVGQAEPPGLGRLVVGIVGPVICWRVLLWRVAAELRTDRVITPSLTRQRGF
jgi:hypothetical protein